MDSLSENAIMVISSSSLENAQTMLYSSDGYVSK